MVPVESITATIVEASSAFLISFRFILDVAGRLLPRKRSRLFSANYFVNVNIFNKKYRKIIVNPVETMIIKG
jgi:hypothetical protein